MRFLTIVTAALILSTQSVSARDLVFADNKDWLEVSATIGEIISACPMGRCTGVIPSSGVDVSGFTWASVDDMSSLLNRYIGSDVLVAGAGYFIPPYKNSRADSYRIAESYWAPKFLSDFGITGLDLGFYWKAALTGESTLNQAVIFRVGDTRQFGIMDSIDVSAFPPSTDFRYEVLLWRTSEESAPQSEPFIVNLEEPRPGEGYSGIGLIRGWAVSDESVNKVEIFIDGLYAFDVPIGGYRSDVKAAYPSIDRSEQSGFAMAFGYSNLESGTHSVAVRAHTSSGAVKESASRFTVSTFHKPYITEPDGVDLTFSHAELKDQDIILREVEVDGEFYTIGLRWQPYKQGFEIVEIR